MILGQHSAAELVEFLKAKDYAHVQLSKAFEAFRAKWAQLDPKVFTAFCDDYDANTFKYNAARNVVVKTIVDAQASLLPLSAYPCEPIWQALLHTDQKIENFRSPGDFDDLDLRLRTAATAANVKEGMPDYSAMPQPTVAADLEGTLYQKTDPAKAAKAVEDAVKDAISAVDHALPKPNPMQTYAIVGGVATALALTGFVAFRVYTRPFLR